MGILQYVLIYDMKEFSWTKNLDTAAVNKISKLQVVQTNYDPLANTLTFWSKVRCPLNKQFPN